MKLLMPAVAGLLLLAACSDGPAAPDPRVPPPMTGAWELVSVAGDTLPTEVILPAKGPYGLRVQLLLRTLTVYPDSTYREQNMTTYGGDVFWVFERTGRFMQTADTCWIERDGEPGERGVQNRAGDELTVRTAEGEAWHYRRPALP
jgi:hypothetical protein